MNDRSKDYLEHFGILGMKWGVRRYQNPDGTLTEAGKRRLRTSDYQKPHTSTEKWKYKQIKEIDKLYEKSYRKLDKAYKEEPLDPSISKYKKQLEDQHAKDRKEIEKMSFVEVESARETERTNAKEARSKAIKSVGGAAMWTAKMALIGVRIGGTVALLNVISDAGRTAMDYLGSEQGQAMIKSGANIITKFGNGELTALNLAKEFFSANASGSIADRALSAIDVSSVLPGANYVPPDKMNRSIETAINSVSSSFSSNKGIDQVITAELLRERELR